jgi:prepilin peptidase CpaA
MALEHKLALIPELTCLAICLAAAVTDTRTMRIPNRLTYSGVMLGLVLGFALPCAAGQGALRALQAGLLPSFFGCLSLLVLFGAMSLMGVMGMGDTKLMAAVGALLKWPLCLRAALCVFIAGGVLSLVLAVARGKLRAVLVNLTLGGKALLGRREPARPIRLHRIPYALAILAGVVWALLASGRLALLALP